MLRMFGSFPAFPTILNYHLKKREGCSMNLTEKKEVLSKLRHSCKNPLMSEYDISLFYFLPYFYA